MKKILIFGNSGSGKSTLANKIANTEGMAHLDLDGLAWLPVSPPVRAHVAESSEKIQSFLAENNSWVIEGCYTDLLDLISSEATEIKFLNLPVDLCIENAKQRPWEPHKYETSKAQDDNLEMLIGWISQYVERDDVFSLQSHMKLYESFVGKKTMYTQNVE